MSRMQASAAPPVGTIDLRGVGIVRSRAGCRRGGDDRCLPWRACGMTGGIRLKATERRAWTSPGRSDRTAYAIRRPGGVQGSLINSIGNRRSGVCFAQRSLAALAATSRRISWVIVRSRVLLPVWAPLQPIVGMSGEGLSGPGTTRRGVRSVCVVTRSLAFVPQS